MSHSKQVLIFSDEKKEEQCSRIKTLISKSDLFEVKLCLYRPDVLETISWQDYDSVLLFAPKGMRDIGVILRFVKTQMDKWPVIFLATDQFSLFKELLDNYSDLQINIINLPRSPEEIAGVIKGTLAPKHFDEAIYRIDMKFVMEFVNATQEVLEQFAGETKIKHERPFFLQNEKLSVAIRGKLLINSSYFSGGFFISFPQETYLKLCQIVLGEWHEEICQENRDFVAELANIIYGRVKARLESSNYRFQMAIPTIGEVEDLKIYRDIIVVPYSSELGNFYLKIGFQLEGGK